MTIYSNCHMKAEIGYSFSSVLTRMICLLKGTNFQWEAHMSVSRDLHILAYVISHSDCEIVPHLFFSFRCFVLQTRMINYKQTNPKTQSVNRTQDMSETATFNNLMLLLLRHLDFRTCTSYLLLGSVLWLLLNHSGLSS